MFWACNYCWRQLRGELVDTSCHHVGNFRGCWMAQDEWTQLQKSSTYCLQKMKIQAAIQLALISGIILHSRCIMTCTTRCHSNSWYSWTSITSSSTSLTMSLAPDVTKNWKSSSFPLDADACNKVRRSSSFCFINLCNSSLEMLSVKYDKLPDLACSTALSMLMWFSCLASGCVRVQRQIEG